MDFIALPQTTSVSLDDIQTSIPPQLGHHFDQLDTDARSSGMRLNRRLQETVDQNDLRRKELLAAQRDATRMNSIGVLPSPTEYWQGTALPRAALLVDPAMAALIHEGEMLGRSLERFLLDLDDSGDPWTIGEVGRTLTAAAADRAIDRLLQAVPSDHAIHTLGAWWHRRLRRTALMRSIPTLVRGGGPGGPDAVIGRAELDLLNGPPWTYGDRLLSAFELAHSEIRTQTGLVMDGLTTRVARRGRAYVAPSERVTIELRD